MEKTNPKDFFIEITGKDPLRSRAQAVGDGQESDVAQPPSKAARIVRGKMGGSVAAQLGYVPLRSSVVG